MFYNRNLPPATPAASPRQPLRIWLPVLVILAGASIIGAALMGVDLSLVWVASTLLSGFVMIYTLVWLVRARLRADKIKTKADFTVRRVAGKDRQKPPCI